jgi:trk system potassium uptake protein TrkH
MMRLLMRLLRRATPRPAASASAEAARLAALGYAGQMALGFALLSLPFAQAAPVAPLDALFVAVSAVSTTGFAPVDPGSSFTGFGQLVILLLIQAGGLGFMTISSFVWTMLGQRGGTTLREQLARRVFSLPGNVVPRIFIARVVIYTLAVEALGTVALAALFARAGVAKPIWSGVFHSVSAFCTAGFSLYADSFIGFNTDAPVLLVISVLAILGAIGFLVAGETWDRLRGGQTRLSISARVILSMTAATIGLGTVVLALTEPMIAAMPPGPRLLNAFFQAMTAATTVGFNAIPTDGIAHLSVMVTYLLMLIGASPSGTGGGLKSTAVATQWAFMLAVLRGREEVTLFGALVPPVKVRQAIATFFMAATVLTAAMFPLVATETLHFEHLLFEAISAFGTVGLSLGATAELTDLGKAVICVVMYLGRVGVLAFGVALAMRQRRNHVIPRREDLAI